MIYVLRNAPDFIIFLCFSEFPQTGIRWPGKQWVIWEAFTLSHADIDIGYRYFILGDIDIGYRYFILADIDISSRYFILAGAPVGSQISEHIREPYWGLRVNYSNLQTQTNQVSFLTFSASSFEMFPSWLTSCSLNSHISNQHSIISGKGQYLNVRGSTQIKKNVTLYIFAYTVHSIYFSHKCFCHF